MQKRETKIDKRGICNSNEVYVLALQKQKY